MSPDQINIRHLAAVVAVVEHGSVSAAAPVVNLTQPAVTQGIAKLETQLGIGLFERGAGGMVPTPAAISLKPRAERALRLIGNNRVTATQIRAFVALAEGGSYMAAAGRTGVTEPSLHRAVGDLAIAVGVRIADRRGRGVMLTAAGESLARRLRLALAELRQGLEEIAALRGQESGRIVVGAMPLSRARLLPAAISAFRRVAPGIDISVVEGSHTELAGPLRDGDVDLMVGALRPATIGQDLMQTALFEDRPTIFCRKGHPLEGGWNTDDLRHHPWIVPQEGTPLRRLWHAMFAELGGPLPAVPIECGSVMTVRQLLIDGDYLTLLSPDQLWVELDGGIVADIGPAPGSISRTIGITTRADWHPTHAQSRFVAAIRHAALSMNS